MTPEKRVVSVRGGMFEVELRCAGEGDPFVFFHGGGGFPGWAPFLDDLSRHYKVYVPMHPGWGESTGLEHLDHPVDMAYYYLDLFDALGLSSIYLLGSSLGGMFAAEVACLGGDYVRKLILQAPAGLWLENALPPESFSMSPEEVARATFHDPEAALATLRAIEHDPDAAARASAEGKRLAQTGRKFLSPTWDKGLKKRLHRIRIPTLLVWGESDGLVPPVYGEEFKKYIPDSKLVIMPKAGHVPSMEQRKEYVCLLREFLEA